MREAVPLLLDSAAVGHLVAGGDFASKLLLELAEMRAGRAAVAIGNSQAGQLSLPAAQLAAPPSLRWKLLSQVAHRPAGRSRKSLREGLGARPPRAQPPPAALSAPPRPAARRAGAGVLCGNRLTCSGLSLRSGGSLEGALKGLNFRAGVLLSLGNGRQLRITAEGSKGRRRLQVHAEKDCLCDVRIVCND